MKHIIKLKGGLGNQMFQYAFGCALMHKFLQQPKQHSTQQSPKKYPQKQHPEILFDNSWFNETGKMGADGERKNGITIRKFVLDIFNLDIDFADEKTLKKIKTGFKIPKFLRKKFPALKYLNTCINEDNPFKYEEKLLNVKKNHHFEGYFQNEKYFKNCADIIKKDFTFKNIEDPQNKALSEKIQNTKNSVFIHIRRGDYLDIGNMALNLEYYKNAIKIIKEKIKDPVFFVFAKGADDYIKNEFNIGEDFEFIKAKGPDYIDMQLMSQCENGIIANSSFSWWAAWLIDKKDKIIIAPSPWLNGFDDIICDSWIKLKR